jgi:hypothetical protein
MYRLYSYERVAVCCHQAGLGIGQQAEACSLTPR